MANTVREGESPADIITSGSYTYLLYADYGVSALSESKYAIKRIDETDPAHVKIRWSGGNKTKQYPANNLTGLTFKTLV